MNTYDILLVRIRILENNLVANVAYQNKTIAKLRATIQTATSAYVGAVEAGMRFYLRGQLADEGEVAS